MVDKLQDILPLTADASRFDKVFVPIEHDMCLNLVNDNQLNIYHLRAENRKFVYTDLTNFCVANLLQYIFNRGDVQKAKSVADIQILANRGRQYLREINNNIDKDKGAGGELGEILLYLFLESELKAPKILSKMEIKTTQNQYVYGADGVHLHCLKNDEIPIYQFIIGEAKIKNDILDATRKAFNSISNSLKEIDIEVALVSGEILKEVCNKKDAEIIKNMIVPREDIGDLVSVHEKAVGLFIGYTGDYEEDIKNSDWNKTINDKIKNDISRAVKTMEKKINELGLKGYSFYCYYLPFNNAEEDRKNILNNIL